MAKGGGSSTTTTFDPAYNQGMLELSQEQQGWAQEMFNMFKYGVTYDPYEREMVEQRQWIPEKSREALSYGAKERGSGSPWADDPRRRALMVGQGQMTREDAMGGGGGRWETKMVEGDRTLGDIRGYDSDSVTSEMEYLQNLIEANQELLGVRAGAEKAGLEYETNLYGSRSRLLPFQEEAERTGLQYQTELSGARRELLPSQQALVEKGIGFQSSFLDEASKGIDTRRWMDEAQAGVQHGYKLAGEALRKDLGQYGLDPSAGRYASQNRGLRMAEASGVAGARTGARRQAEAEDFRRKEIAARGLQIPQI